MPETCSAYVDVPGKLDVQLEYYTRSPPSRKRCENARKEGFPWCEEHVSKELDHQRATLGHFMDTWKSVPGGGPFQEGIRKAFVHSLEPTAKARREIWNPETEHFDDGPYRLRRMPNLYASRGEWAATNVIYFRDVPDIILPFMFPEEVARQWVESLNRWHRAHAGL